MAKQLLNNLLETELTKKKIAFRIVGIRHFPSLYNEIDSRYQAGEIEPEIYHNPDYLETTERSFPVSIENPTCLIITAYPQPTVELKFQIQNQLQTIPIPPTYNSRTDEEIEGLLRVILKTHGASVIKIRLPLKLLATRSGLAKYGKNNIAYIEYLGSYFRLAAYVTNYVNFEDSWQEPELMEKCQRCQICVKKCPTGALTPDRFMVDTNRCLTFLNESEKDFPDWLNPYYHNALVGCMMCQKDCPLNRKICLQNGATIVFSETELDYLRNLAPSDSIPADIQEKLNMAGLEDYYKVIISRNLRAFLRE